MVLEPFSSFGCSHKGLPQRSTASFSVSSTARLSTSAHITISSTNNIVHGASYLIPSVSLFITTANKKGLIVDRSHLHLRALSYSCHTSHCCFTISSFTMYTNLTYLSVTPDCFLQYHCLFHKIAYSVNCVLKGNARVISRDASVCLASSSYWNLPRSDTCCPALVG